MTLSTTGRIIGGVGSEPFWRATQSGVRVRALFASAVCLGAALVFLLEPMIAKLVLPTLGGAPAVWNTSLAFFQAALLVGYGYAHLLTRVPSLRRQVLIHGVVVVAAALVLPLRVSDALGEPGAHDPTLWLLGTLALSVGPPFAALSATAPLLQAWYARIRHGEADAANPYVLYAASNAGSLFALLAYPIVLEPTLRLGTQTLAWSLGYAAFALVLAIVGTTVWPLRQVSTRSGAAGTLGVAFPLPWPERLRWVLLAAVPSSLMQGVTTHLSSDIASAPLLWVAPLALYLLTFVIAFQAKPWIGRDTALMFQAATFVACLLTIGLSLPYLPQVGLDLAGFFLTALVCHQALADRRPAADRLTEFYLLVALGGVIGGAFNAFAAPLLFKTVLEYPLVLALSCLARPWNGAWPRGRGTWLLALGLGAALAAIVSGHLFGYNGATRALLAVAVVTTFLLRATSIPYVGLSAALLISSLNVSPREDVLLTDRSFFGVVRVSRSPIPGFGEARIMVHGTTMHGAELTDPAERCRPLVYYAPTTPIGQVFRSVQARKPSVRIGAIGMGAGTVAAYTRPGDSLRFFEIDPLVVRVAGDPNFFSYIDGCAKGRIDHVLGDARLTLGHEAEDQFDLLLVDAFSSDSVPAHLLTVEAMRGYLRHIRPDGVVVLHLSNNNLELLHPAAGIAAAAGGAALAQTYRPPAGAVDKIDVAEDALIVARDPAALAPFRGDPRWKAADPGGVAVWTDDYTNLVGALVRGFGHADRELRE